MTEIRHHFVVPGDTLSAIARQHGSTVYAIFEANSIDDMNEIWPGEVLHVPVTSAAPEPEPDPPIDEPAEAPDPEDPTLDEPVLGTRSYVDAHVIRTGSLSVDDGRAKIDQVEAWLGRPVMSWSHIGGAWNPRGTGKPSPITRLDMWDVDRSPFNHMIDRAIEHGRVGSDILIEFTLPLGLRGNSPSPNGNPDADDLTRSRSMDQVRRSLTEVAEGAHRWGWKNAASDNLPYASAVGTDQIYTYCRAVLSWWEEMRRRYGVEHAPRLTCRGPWEFWGFTVFPWSPAGLVDYRDRSEIGPDEDRIHRVTTADGIVLDSGVQITTEMEAVFHRDDAIDEFCAAYQAQALILGEHGIPLSFCGDKRGLDVMLDGAYAGRNILDVLVDKLGPTLTTTGLAGPYGKLGPTCLGPDFYVSENYIDRAAFDARYRPTLDHALWHADQLGVPMALGEIGYGSGREDETTADSADTIDPLLHLADWLDEHADRVALASWFVPNKGGHDLHLAQNPTRRQFLHGRYATGAGDVLHPIYPGE